MGSALPTFYGAFSPALRGRSYASPAGTVGAQVLPSDPIGVATVTFDGVFANSEIRVYSPAGVEVAGIELCAAYQILSWPIFSNGSPNNTVTIRIINWLYKIKEFDYRASLGNNSLPIQQERDKWSLNPP
jgi:hypothetical protein